VQIDFYFAPGSCAFAGLVALEETGLPYSPKRLDLAAGDQRSSAFLGLNPRGRVPTLVVDGKVITETIAVLTFLANARPEAELLPSGDPLKLARAYEWMSWFASGVHVTIAQLWRSGRFTDNEAAQRELQEAAPSLLQKAFSEIEARLETAWALGDRFSVVDPYLAVFHRWGSGRLAMDMTQYPRWQRHFDRLTARPAAQRALNVEQAVRSKVDQ
jgi:glutathione S-transferase